MGNWWKIARLELKLAAIDKEAVIWSLIAPIAFAWFFGAVFGGGAPGPTQVSLDRGNNPEYVEHLFTGYLNSDKIVVTEGRKARIQLPDSLVYSIVNGQKAEILVMKGGLSDSRAQAISMQVQQIVLALTFGVKKSWLDTEPAQREIDDLVAARGPIYVDFRVLGKQPKIAEGAEHNLPAMVVMFLLFKLTTFFMVMWVQDVSTGKIKRITISPTTVRELFLGQVVSRFLWGCLQVVIIGGVGALILKVRLELPWVYVFLMLFAYMITVISLGLLLASFFKTIEKANAVGVITALVLAALGGCWWPLEVVSPAMRTAAMFLPTGLMMSALGDFTAYGRDAAFPVVNFFGLLLMTAVFFPVGIHRLKKQITG